MTKLLVALKGVTSGVGRVPYRGKLLMTSTNENRTQAGFDPGKSGFEFFKELIQSPSLYIFSAGILLILVALAGNIPGVGRIPAWGTIVSLLFGGWLAFIPTKLQKQENRHSKLRQEYAQLDKALEIEQNISKQLSEAIEQAISLLETKENKDSTDLRVIGVLQAKTIQLLQDLQGSPNHRLAADWFRGKKSQWMNFVKELDYDLLDNRAKHTQFINDIEKHLNLLSDNLRNDVYRTPKVEGLTKSINDSFVYIRVFRDLRTKIRVEMESDKDIIRYQGIDYLNQHLDAFIDLIND